MKKKINPKIFFAISNVHNFLLIVDFLHSLRVDRVLLHIAADGMDEILYVFVGVFADFIRGTECWFGGWRCNERTKWCLLGSSYVRTIPAVLRFLCIIWCHSDLSAMDHLFIIYSIWFRRNRSGNILIWSRKIEVPSNLLPLPFTRNHITGIGHAWRQLHPRYCCLSRNFHIFAYLCIRFLKLEIAFIAINAH